MFAYDNLPHNGEAAPRQIPGRPPGKAPLLWEAQREKHSLVD